MNYNKIILISLDTLRADGINFNPLNLYKKEYEINVSMEKSLLDDLASQSFFFNNAISAAPYTAASHAAYFTGSWPKNNGLYDQFNSKLKIKNVFEIMRENNFNTIFKTDFPFILGKYLNMTQGVNQYFIEDDDGALSTLASLPKAFAFFHFGQIHYPYGFHSLKFGGKDYMNKLEQLESKYGLKKDSVSLEDMASETFRTPEDLECLYRYKKIISHLYKNGLDSDLFNLYLEGINYFHKNKFNSFLEKLLESTEKDNTLIIIFSDHGEAWNENSYGHHNSLDEGVIRVPIMFIAKDIKPQIYANRIRTVDLAPTIFQLIDIQPNFVMDGASLRNIIFDNRIDPDRDAFSAIWVNKSEDVLQNMNQLVKNDRIESRDDISIKYAATFYRGDYKYLEQYNKFIDRSEKIGKTGNRELYKISDDNNLFKTSDPNMERELSASINDLNRIRAVNSHLSNDELKKYFNLQGYNI